MKNLLLVGIQNLLRALVIVFKYIGIPIIFLIACAMMMCKFVTD